jgi:hypothetical protein
MPVTSYTHLLIFKLIKRATFLNQNIVPKVLFIQKEKLKEYLIGQKTIILSFSMSCENVSVFLTSNYG